MSSVSLILMAMFTTLNAISPGGHIDDPALAQSQFHFLVLAAVMAATLAVLSAPRRRKEFKGGSVLHGAKVYQAGRMAAR